MVVIALILIWQEIMIPLIAVVIRLTQTTGFAKTAINLPLTARKKSDIKTLEIVRKKAHLFGELFY